MMGAPQPEGCSTFGPIPESSGIRAWCMFNNLTGAIFIKGVCIAVPISCTTKQGGIMTDPGKFDSLGIVIAHTAAVHEGAQQAVSLGLEAMRRGKRVGFFLLSDGVFNAIQGSGDVATGLNQVISDGGKVFLSSEHVLAAGIPTEKLITGTETLEKAYEALVDLIMEDWDRVIIC